MCIFHSILGFLIGFSLVFLTIPPLIRVSIAKHLYDAPNERKATKTVVPTLGGVAIFIGFIISSAIATDGYDFDELKYIIVAVVFMFFLGLKDDLMDISALKKLMVQVTTAVILIVLGGLRFSSLHGIFGLYEINYPISFAITLFTMIGLINAFNLIDGIDGLASGISVVISSVFGTWFLLAGHNEYGIICFSLAGSLVGFFIFNVFGKKNKTFMGDTGSLILGVVMSILVIKFNELNINQEQPFAIHAAPVVSIGILIIPVIDTIRVFFIRLSEKRSPFSPDMNHIHHNFLKLGYSHLESTLFMVTINILFIAFTLSLHRYLNINNLMIIVFSLGFIAAYMPSLIFKLKQSASGTNERLIYHSNMRKKEVIPDQAISLSDFKPEHTDIPQKKIASKKELVESDIF
jgi:UDP-N-acetylmuramyl pentapeptide phosphotransferase/UDP-N-acetylglucosamine-1-phosphate transferase